MPEQQNNVIMGLNENEVAARENAGLVNKAEISTDKSVKEIIRSNTLTYFNLIFFIIAVLLCVVGSFRNLTFLPVVIGNSLIGIFQEIRAKKTLEKMSILNSPHAVAIRSGRQVKISTEELVKDDVVVFSAGDQICADAVVISGNIKVNEALLTGESDEIEKVGGSSLMSGSFVVSGQCCARLVNVGEEAYIYKLTKEAKEMGSGEQSEMVKSINQIVKWMGIAIIPIGLILFYQSYWINHETFKTGIVSTVAAITGMIPEGLYMLTTIALALGTIRLAQQKVLLHDMKSIEALARVDVLCVDKTGTITEPNMTVDNVYCLNNGLITPEELKGLFVDYATAAVDNNATMLAIKDYAAVLNTNGMYNKRTAVSVQPFSSTDKFSTITFRDGTFILGAPEFVMKDNFESVAGEITPFAEKGYRVLLLAKKADSGMTEPLGFVVLSNPIRKGAVKTFQYFNEQNVAIKVISGDSPKTVSEVAKQAGIANSDKYIDASLLDTDEKIKQAAVQYTVFGRVTPKQKQKLVKALQEAGHTVAMTGDGVNDILAMKDADCSVAMASGSEAASQAAQVVLMDSDFSKMPDVVFEGRRVVNNIQRSSSLFLVKNIFSLLLSVFSAVFLITYPLEPSQISLIGMFTIGIPGFLLALEPNKNRIQGHFLKNVLLKALPAGLADVLAVGALVVCGNVFSLPKEDIATASTMLLCVIGFMILINISKPFTPIKYGILALNVTGLVLCGIFLKSLFALTSMKSEISILLMVVFSFAGESIYRNLSKLIELLNSKLDEYKKNRAEKKAQKSKN
ncbi:MAG: ATPase P [Clostridiales bacterium 41_21_two_genomes]|jgi:cation-transporting ATPase E|nr:MAG: ATPase P [Clostridiales bacterium 41_21_two_genomes]